jgi:hypothetical protein
MLQYALLHLFGYDLSIDDLKAFRVCFFDVASLPMCIYKFHSLLIAGLPVTPRLMPHPALRSPLALSVRVFPTQLVWPLPKPILALFLINLDSTLLTTIPTLSWAMAV